MPGDVNISSLAGTADESSLLEEVASQSKPRRTISFRCTGYQGQDDNDEIYHQTGTNATAADQTDDLGSRDGDKSQEEPTMSKNPDVGGSSETDDRDDTESIRTRGKKNGKKNQPPTDILDREIPSDKQEMREMIESLRERIEDLQITLDGKDDMISNYEKYIEKLKEKQAEIERFGSLGQVRFVRQDSQVKEEEGTGKVSPEKEANTGAEGGEGPGEGTVSCNQNGAGAISKRENEDVNGKREELSEDESKSMRESEDDLEPHANAKKDKKKDKAKSKPAWWKKKDKSDSCKKRGNVSLVTVKESPAEIQTSEDETRFNTKECETASSRSTGHESRDAIMDQPQSANQPCQTSKHEEIPEHQDHQQSSREQTRDEDSSKKWWKRNKADQGGNKRRRTKSINAVTNEDLLIELRGKNEMIANYKEDIDRLTNERQIFLEGIREQCSDAETLEVLKQLCEYRKYSSRDWILERDEIQVSENKLGVGAWGTVSEGIFRRCPIAVKQVHDLILSPRNRRVFEREMSIASRCRHPNLLQFIGATNDAESPLFVTELLDTTLRSLLSERVLQDDEIICLALDVSLALNYLHLNKPSPIMHRDISSSNVLLWKRGDSWRAKLSDYGAANFMRENMTAYPGAWIYSAPEAQTSQQTPKVDVYSFGLLLCEMCTRKLPDPTQMQQQIGLVTNKVLRDLIEQCVRKEPEARPEMSDVIDILVERIGCH